MSQVTIQEAKNLRYGIDVIGTIKSMSTSKLVNLPNGDVAYVSNAQLSDGFGHVIKVAFWDDDIKKVRNNLKIRIRNAYTKTFNGEVILSKSKHGSIEALQFNPDVIFDDIEKFHRNHKNIKSFEQYYDFIKNLNTEIYCGTKKADYLEIIDAFITIEYARKRQTKQNTAELSALFYLHRVVTLSPVRIRQILRLFGININIERILRLSYEWSAMRFKLDFPKIKHKVFRKIEEIDNEEIDRFEFVYELPEEIMIDDEIKFQDKNIPLCQSSIIDFDRKYKGYHKFYDEPWR